MSYIVVYTKASGDGDIKINTFHTGASLRRFLFLKKLNPSDFAVINGEVLKSFDHKSIDLKTLKGE